MMFAPDYRTIFDQNNRFAWLVFDYLDKLPQAITAELFASIETGGALTNPQLFCILMQEFMGLDVEKNQLHQVFDREYFPLTVHQLDANIYKQNDYYKNIAIGAQKLGNWEFCLSHYEPYEAFVCNDLLLTAEMREVPQIGFFSEPFSYPAVHQNGREWMAIKPSEIESMREVIDEVKGRVVTFGLGMGYFAYMASQKVEVENVTVVETDEQVIKLFNKVVLPQFANPQKVIVVKMDAFQFMSQRMPHCGFNYAFVDLWHDAADGLELYLRTKRLEHLSPQTQWRYWVENVLLSAYRWNYMQKVPKDLNNDDLLMQISNQNLRKMALSGK